jgi:hypothetical protein
MKEFDGSGVEEIPSQSRLGGRSDFDPRRGSIEGVTDYGMADGREVNAQLVRSARPRVGLDQGEMRPTAEHAEGGDRIAGVQAAGFHPHTPPGVAAHRARNLAAPALYGAVHEQQICLSNLARFELSGKRTVGEIVLGDDDKAGGHAVKPVHDAGPRLAYR